jgi:predicted AlkP superfamily pyrophosphatase or phosphodiesterase
VKQSNLVQRAGNGKVPEGADDTPVVETKGEPFYLTKKHLDVFDIGQRNAARVGPLCLQYLRDYKSMRFVTFFHFSDPDHAGHGQGSGSPEYRKAAATCDGWLGKMVVLLRKEKGYDSTPAF